MSHESKIDVHAHFLPPFYRQACLKTGHGKPDGMPGIPEWDEETHLALMKATSISKAIISISSPGVHLKPGDKEFNSKLAQQCNDYANELVARLPEKFAFWASLHLPDIEGSIAEIRRVRKDLKAVGFILETNHHGFYLGDPILDEVFKELDSFGAKLFIHPTTPCLKHGEHGHTPVTLLPHFPNPMLEFMFDTARAVSNLFASGTLARYPNIKFIIPHAAGALPAILQRFSSIAGAYNQSNLDLSMSALKETFRKQFFFDLAGFPFPDQIHALLRVADVGTLFYGSDYPFSPASAVVQLAKVFKAGVEGLEAASQMKTGDLRERIYRGNAMLLLGEKEGSIFTR